MVDFCSFPCILSVSQFSFEKASHTSNVSSNDCKIMDRHRFFFYSSSFQFQLEVKPDEFDDGIWNNPTVIDVDPFPSRQDHA